HEVWQAVHQAVHFRRLFFFSSRRRHTRSLRDWSSDVCSSDLLFNEATELSMYLENQVLEGGLESLEANNHKARLITIYLGLTARSEERRVGKECRSRWAA